MFRLVLIPAFGITIPLVTGMVRPSSMHPYQLVSAFLYTILIAFVVWQGNRYFLFTLRDYFDWFNKPVKRIFALLIAICFYTIPVSIAMHIGWYRLFTDGSTDWNTVYLSTTIILVCVMFISHTYETVFLVKESENEKLRSEQLQRAKYEAELQALNSQVDPHFLFNSLNTLSHLIEETPSKAVEFNDNLADVYRYILQNRSKDLVTLEEELAFTEKYFFLLKKRFGSAVEMSSKVSLQSLQRYFVPPISVQTLVENAVKHNRFDGEVPLHIVLEQKNETLVVSNNERPRKSGRDGGTGLKNLEQRYRLIMNRPIQIENGNGAFSVSIPLFKST
jgi:sensor histidine kinase YesM